MERKSYRSLQIGALPVGAATPKTVSSSVAGAAGVGQRLPARHLRLAAARKAERSMAAAVIHSSMSIATGRPGAPRHDEGLTD